MPRRKDLGSEKSQKRIWASFSKALGSELREHRSIKGISGLDHPVQAVAVDDKNSRIFIFSAEPNPRVAALMQVDVQAAMPGAHVLVARPIALDLGAVVRSVFSNVDDANLRIDNLQEKMDKVSADIRAHNDGMLSENPIGGLLLASLNALGKVELPPLSQIISLLQQISYLDWPKILEDLEKNQHNAIISLAGLMHFDSIAIDREHGICPIPLYEFRERDWELLLSGRRIKDIEERLKEMDVFQYFFPPADQLALGAVERGVNAPSDVLDIVHRAPKSGHPLGQSELLKNPSELPQILERLGESGYIAEGEYGVSVTEKGTTARAKIKFRPREGALTKIINRFSVKFNASLNTKDFI